MPTSSYDPSARRLTFFDQARRFAEGGDTPRKYLERCLETIAAREPAVQAWVTMNRDGARAAADEAGARYKAGRRAVGGRWLPDRHQGPDRDQGHADGNGHAGDEGSCDARGLGFGAGASARWRGDRRQAGDDRDGHVASGADDEPVGCGADTGRFIIWFSGGGGGGYGAGCTWYAGRRLDHSAVELLRQHFAEADAGRAQSRRAARLQPIDARPARQFDRRHVGVRLADRIRCRRRSGFARPLR